MTIIFHRLSRQGPPQVLHVSFSDHSTHLPFISTFSTVFSTFLHNPAISLTYLQRRLFADPLKLDDPHPRIGVPAVEGQIGGLDGAIPHTGKSISG